LHLPNLTVLQLFERRSNFLVHLVENNEKLSIFNLIASESVIFCIAGGKLGARNRRLRRKHPIFQGFCPV
jgi:hypothetical protein